MAKKVTVKDWVDALRSGEYRQGSLVLKRLLEDSPDEFCCLGVLCDLVDPLAWDNENANEDVGTVPWKAKGEEYHEFLPETLEKTLIVKYDDDYLIVNQRYFSGLNDEGKTFHEIADRIEQIYPLDKVIWSEDD